MNDVKESWKIRLCFHYVRSRNISCWLIFEAIETTAKKTTSISFNPVYLTVFVLFLHFFHRPTCLKYVTFELFHAVFLCLWSASNVCLPIKAQVPRVMLFVMGYFMIILSKADLYFVIFLLLYPEQWRSNGGAQPPWTTCYSLPRGGQQLFSLFISGQHFYVWAERGTKLNVCPK